MILTLYGHTYTHIYIIKFTRDRKEKQNALNFNIHKE